ncbi:MAG TPA: ribonuclease HII [bacterium]|nr:ribonuclease HII [bacterium]
MPNPPALPEIEAQALKAGSPQKALEAAREMLQEDTRAGAKRLLAKFEKRVLLAEKEQQRLEKLLHHEREGFSKGYRLIAGVDEAGRGPLAGPVVAAAVILSPEQAVAGVDDSKKLTAAKREELFTQIHRAAASVGVGQASVAEIDELNIYRAAQLAMERAITALGLKPDYLLTDAMPLPKLSAIPQKPLVHGDALSLSIASASIIAKVTRDRLMGELHSRYPHYGFEGHKGYGTEEHMMALDEHGPCPEHRLSFGPVMETLAKKSPEGPFGYWRDKLTNAKSITELQQVGLQIKRVGLGQITEKQARDLRELFKAKRGQF